jgi:hypothetical protein
MVLYLDDNFKVNSFAIGTTSNHPLILGTNNVFPALTIDTSW